MSSPLVGEHTFPVTGFPFAGLDIGYSKISIEVSIHVEKIKVGNDLELQGAVNAKVPS